MLNKIKKLLGIHVHDFSGWTQHSLKSSRYGNFILLQSRVCKCCNYIELRKQEL